MIPGEKLKFQPDIRSPIFFIFQLNPYVYFGALQ